MLWLLLQGQRVLLQWQDRLQLALLQCELLLLGLLLHHLQPYELAPLLLAALLRLSVGALLLLLLQELLLQELLLQELLLQELQGLLQGLLLLLVLLLLQGLLHGPRLQELQKLTNSEPTNFAATLPLTLPTFLPRTLGVPRRSCPAARRWRTAAEILQLEQVSLEWLLCCALDHHLPPVHCCASHNCTEHTPDGREQGRTCGRCGPLD